ncbi:hypothetical protein V8E53_004052 [Lactarius tabidus]
MSATLSSTSSPIPQSECGTRKSHKSFSSPACRLPSFLYRFFPPQQLRRTLPSTSDRIRNPDPLFRRPRIRKKLRRFMVVPFVAPMQLRIHSFLSPFFQTPVSGEEKKRCIRGAHFSLQSFTYTTAVHRREEGLVQYLLIIEQMVENDFPVPCGSISKARMVDTEDSSFGCAEVPHVVYAIDHEMCMTTDGQALTCVCVIDFDMGTVAYEQFVERASETTSYLTHNARPRNNDACRRVNAPSHIDNTFDNPAGSFDRIGIAGVAGTTPRNMRACIDLLKGLCLTRVVRSHLRNRGSNGARTRTAIVDNDNPGAWNGMSATEPAKTVPAS